MKRRNTTSYLALLLSVTLAGGAMSAIAPAQARLTGETAVMNTVLHARSGGMTSDCLTRDGQTIVLGESTEVEITLETTDAFVGELKWEVLDSAPLTAEMSFSLTAGSGVMHENHWLELDAGCAGVLTLSLTGAEEIAEAQTARVRVSCGELSGIFQLELLPTGETAQTAEGDAEEDSEASDTTTVTPSLPTTAAEVQMQTLAEFDENTWLPVKLTVTGGVKRLELGLYRENPLPEHTRYSLDGGESWYLLYDGGYVELEPDHIQPDSWTGTVLLDLPASALIPEETVMLEVRGYAVGVCVAEASASALLTQAQDRTTEVPVLTRPGEEELALLESYLYPEETAGEEATGGETQEETAQPDFTDQPESGWVADSYFTVPLPSGWTPEQVVCFYAELLEPDADGNGVYTPVTWTAGGLNAVVDEATESLVVYLGTAPTRAGTYRLTMECQFEGVCFHRTRMTFFINYSTRSDAQQEEVPDNE